MLGLLAEDIEVAVLELWDDTLEVEDTSIDVDELILPMLEVLLLPSEEL